MIRQDTTVGKGVLKRKVSETSESSVMWSESDDQRIDPIMYEEFVTIERLQEDLTTWAEDLREQIMEESRANILSEADEMMEAKVGDA